MERIELLYSRDYASVKKEYMSKEKTDRFKHPCVWSISKSDGSLRLLYSSKIKKDTEGSPIHFGTPKVIWVNWNRAGVPYADIKGEYGLAEHAVGIVDKVEVLHLIAKAMNSYKFRNIMAKIQYTTHEWDLNIIKNLRKDFWKEFV